MGSQILGNYRISFLQGLHGDLAVGMWPQCQAVQDMRSRIAALEADRIYVLPGFRVSDSDRVNVCKDFKVYSLTVSGFLSSGFTDSAFRKLT